jgi:hypothetical protein
MMMKNEGMIEKKFLQADYSQFLQDILTKIQSARYDMLQSVSRQTVLLYWEIGKAVSENFQTKSWGKFVVKQLSKDLQTEFPDVRGFSARNIWRMKTFYEYYNVALQITGNDTNKNSATTVALNSVVETQTTKRLMALINIEDE